MKFLCALLLLLGFPLMGNAEVWISNAPQAGYLYNSQVYIQDDFIFGTTSDGSVGSLGFNISGTLTAGPLVANRPGILTVSTGAVSGTIARLNTFGGQTRYDVLNVTTWVFNVVTNDINTIVRAGNSSSWGTDPPTDGAYFERLDTDTNWYCVTRAGSVSATRIDTGIASSTTYRKFTVVTSASQVLFYIDNVLVGTQTTNIPSAGTTIVPGIHIKNSAAASKSINIDYFELRLAVIR